MEYIDIREAAARWGITERRATALCYGGRIAGAKKDGKKWMIPQSARKPLDGRKSRGGAERRMPLPVGVSDYIEASTSFYYVDKTLMIKDFLDTRPKVSLFTRPQQFGKTLNMDMLRVFFERSAEDTSVYFKDKRIWSCGEEYQKHQGKYPVIYMTFKDLKYETWDATRDILGKLLGSEFSRHQELLDSPKCGEHEQAYYRSVINGSASEAQLTIALAKLSQMLHQHYGTAPVIIVDEYDTPIAQGYEKGYYNKIILFMRNLFSGAFKDNRHLSFGFLTGTLRAAEESVFSGMNNLKVFSIMEKRFSSYFGFTRDDVQEMLTYYGKVGKYEEVCQWYNGYMFGSSAIFNPWSVINYLDENCVPKVFWQATGNNAIIQEITKEATPEIREDLRTLIQGRTIFSYVDTAVIYPDIKNNPSTIYSFLLASGYLKLVSIEKCLNGNSICGIAIPNKEISCIYGKEILSELYAADN